MFAFFLAKRILLLSLPSQLRNGDVAQLVEQRTENPCVGGSIPSITTPTEAEKSHPNRMAFSLRGLCGEWSVVTEVRCLLRRIFPNLSEVDCKQSFRILYLQFMTQPLPYCTYVLFSEKDAMLYVGYSANLSKRLIDHNSGGTKSTAYRRPLTLIFCEFYLFEADARNREMYFKTTSGKKALKLMLRSTLHTLGYAERVSFIFSDPQ